MQNQKERVQVERAYCRHQGKAETVAIIPRKCRTELSCCAFVTLGTYLWEKIGKVFGNSSIIPIDFFIWRSYLIALPS